MQLYVMRHGPAEDRAASGRDFDRRLTPAGRVVVARVAAAFRDARRAGEAPAAPLRILASPRARADETAKIVQSFLPDAPAIEIREELGGEAAIPLSFIAEAAESEIDTLLVGHQPVVEELVKQLLDGAPGLPGFSTATLVGLDWAPQDATWTLALHLDPARLPG